MSFLKMVHAIIPTMLQILCAGIVVAASLNDIATRTVPNKLVMLLGAAGVTLHLVDGHLVASLVAGTLVFSISTWFWGRGWMGGGDVKLLGATVLGIAPCSVLSFVTAVAISGGFLAILYLIARPLVGTSSPTRPNGLLARVGRAERWRIKRGGPLPYACAIAAGLLCVIV